MESIWHAVFHFPSELTLTACKEAGHAANACLQVLHSWPIESGPQRQRPQRHRALQPTVLYELSPS